LKRSFGIDLVRALSILLVMLRHYGYANGFNFGTYAIEYLFVISGFLIGQILFNDFYSSSIIEPASLKRFMIRRWFRILPMYYFALMIKFIVHPAVGWNILYYIFFLQNHFYGISFYLETWTLVIDEWFYLITPVLLFVFMRFVSMKKAPVALFVAGIILVINIARAAWVYHSNASWENLNGNVPFRQDTLLIGVLLAFVKMHYRPVFDKMNARNFFLISMLAFSGYITMMYTLRIPTNTVNNFFWTRTINFSLCSLIIVISLPYIENSILAFKSLRMKLINRMVVWGSKLSYALYLMHFGVYEATIYLFSPLKIDIKWMGLIAIPLSVLVSYVLYLYLEKTFLIIRDKYFPDRPFAKA
jgi:peptidoglycan/LPS O-acetylase OafA/YrhL